MYERCCGSDVVSSRFNGFDGCIDDPHGAELFLTKERCTGDFFLKALGLRFLTGGTNDYGDGFLGVAFKEFV